MEKSSRFFGHFFFKELQCTVGQKLSFYFNGILIKFIYSERATKFETGHYSVMSKKKELLSQIAGNYLFDKIV